MSVITLKPLHCSRCGAVVGLTGDGPGVTKEPLGNKFDAGTAHDKWHAWLDAQLSKKAEA